MESGKFEKNVLSYSLFIERRFVIITVGGSLRGRVARSKSAALGASLLNRKIALRSALERHIPIPKERSSRDGERQELVIQ